MNFYSLLNFYPLVLGTFYPPDPQMVGFRAMRYGFSIDFGATLVTLLLSYTKGHIREMLGVSCVIMSSYFAPYRLKNG